MRLGTIAADYDGGVIDGLRFREATDRVQAELQLIDSARIKSATGREAAEILGARDPAYQFETASIDRQRAVVNALCEVKVHAAPRGSHRFDPETVEIIWRIGQPEIVLA